MSKRFKGLICAYCSERPSETGDHVFAREFFLKTQRANLPQVPACGQCNGAKSKLEHYLTAILPFGGRHEDALTNLRDMVAPRLSNNKKLHREISQNASPIWTQTNSGLHVQTTALPFQSDRFVDLFRYVVRGLIFYHWGVRITIDHLLDVYLLASGGRDLFDRFMQMPAKTRVSANLGNHTFVYDGIQGIDNDAVSVWRFSVYGGLTLTGDPKALGEEAGQIGVLTGPKRASEGGTSHAKWSAGMGSNAVGIE